MCDGLMCACIVHIDVFGLPSRLYPAEISRTNTHVQPVPKFPPVPRRRHHFPPCPECELVDFPPSRSGNKPYPRSRRRSKMAGYAQLISFPPPPPNLQPSPPLHPTYPGPVGQPAVDPPDKGEGRRQRRGRGGEGGAAQEQQEKPVQRKIP